MRVEPPSYLQYIDGSLTEIWSWTLLLESYSDTELLELLVPLCISEVKRLQSV